MRARADRLASRCGPRAAQINGKIVLAIHHLKETARERRRTDMSDHGSESESPVIPSPTPKRTRPKSNRDWWPNQLDLSVLNKHSPRSNPMGEDFNYAEEFKTLDVEALKRDIIKLMTTS